MTIFKVGDVVQYQHVQAGMRLYNGWVGIVIRVGRQDLETGFGTVVVRWVVCGRLDPEVDKTNSEGVGTWDAHPCNLVLLGSMNEVTINE